VVETSLLVDLVCFPVLHFQCDLLQLLRGVGVRFLHELPQPAVPRHMAALDLAARVHQPVHSPQDS